MILDSNLSYEHHIKSILNKVNKKIGLLRISQLMLPRHSLITIYETFVRPHLDYGDAIFDRAFNQSFHQRFESIQYNAAIAVTGVIRGTFSQKLFQELGLETLKSRRWFRKLYLIYKVLHSKSPSYIFKLTLFLPSYFIPTFDQGCADLRTPDKILTRATAVLKLLQHLY